MDMADMDIDVGDIDVEMFGSREKPEPSDQPPGAGIGVSGSGDRIVRTIDVFVQPRMDPETQLYVFQYPLRPPWRPYDFDPKNCEVKFKPQIGRVEMEIGLDCESENYDEDAPDSLRMKKMVLTSAPVPHLSSYALHLNPVDGTVQLRPHPRHLDESDAKKKAKAAPAASKAEEQAEEQEDAVELQPLQVQFKQRETERQAESRLNSHAYLKQQEEAEPWKSLSLHLAGSASTQDAYEKLFCPTSYSLLFNMPKQEYVSAIVPAAAAAPVLPLDHSSLGKGSLSRSYLDSLPLEARLQAILTEGNACIHRYSRIKRLAPPDVSEAALLGALFEMAVLVQGCWVAKSRVAVADGPRSALRDYLLLLFSQNRFIVAAQLSALKFPADVLRDSCMELAHPRTGHGWEFREPTDVEFLAEYQAVAESAVKQWSALEPDIRKALMAHSGTLRLHTNGDLSLEAGPLSPHNIHGPFSPHKGPLTAEVLEALPEVLRSIFNKHHVLSNHALKRWLAQAASEGWGGLSPQAVRAARAAGATSPAAFESAIAGTLSNIGGKYFLTTLNNPSLDPFRSVIISLLLKKAALRKSDIREETISVLKADVSNAVYMKVLKELCVSKGGAWVLKSGEQDAIDLT
eukprot:jgi/Chlat1/6452/Chrsp45S06052